jgi:hypothetical protein
MSIPEKNEDLVDEAMEEVSRALSGPGGAVAVSVAGYRRCFGKKRGDPADDGAANEEPPRERSWGPGVCPPGFGADGMKKCPGRSAPPRPGRGRFGRDIKRYTRPNKSTDSDGSLRAPPPATCIT